MSLEAEVSRLATAIETLTAALSKVQTVVPAQTAAEAPVAEAPVAEAPKKTRGRPSKDAAPVVEEAAAPVVEETPVVEEEPEVDDLGLDEPVAEAITKESLKVMFTDLSKTPGKGRDAVLSIFKKLGATTFDGIPESKFAEAVALIKKA